MLFHYYLGAIRLYHRLQGLIWDNGTNLWGKPSLYVDYVNGLFYGLKPVIFRLMSRHQMALKSFHPEHQQPTLVTLLLLIFVEHLCGPQCLHVLFYQADIIPFEARSHGAWAVLQSLTLISICLSLGCKVPIYASSRERLFNSLLIKVQERNNLPLSGISNVSRPSSYPNTC